MNIHVLLHFHAENEAFIGEWAKSRNHRISRTALYLNEELPDTQSVDMLIVMGGPMNVYEDDIYTFLKPEKEFIHKVLYQGKKVIGICLGAQLLSVVLGGQVSRNSEKEIGWLDVSWTDEGKKSTFYGNFPEKFSAFHWHGDTFSIPTGAVRLLESEGCTNQAFLWKNLALGLQFHLEFTRESLEKILATCGDEIRPAKYVQTPSEMRAKAMNFLELNQRMIFLFDRFLEL